MRNSHQWIITGMDLTGVSLTTRGLGIEGRDAEGYCDKCKKPYDPLDSTECKGESSDGAGE